MEIKHIGRLHDIIKRGKYQSTNQAYESKYCILNKIKYTSPYSTTGPMTVSPRLVRKICFILQEDFI